MMRQNTIEVIINEDHGYANWIWHPNMNEEEFVSWWNSLTDSDIIKYYFNIKSLPGSIKLQKRENENSQRPYYYCHINDVNDSYMCIGNDVYRFRSRMRYDWKEHWIDYQLNKQKV